MDELMGMFFRGCYKVCLWLEKRTDWEGYLILLALSGVVTSLFGVVASFSLSAAIMTTSFAWDAWLWGVPDWNHHKRRDAAVALLCCVGFAVAGFAVQILCAFFGDGVVHFAGRFGFNYSWIVYSLLACPVAAALASFLTPDFLNKICEGLGVDAGPNPLSPPAKD